MTEYVKYIESKKHIKCNKISFRDNDKYIFTLKKDDKKIYSMIREKDLFLTAFQLSVLQRESCMDCKYAKDKRVSDITIGDFWGIKKDKKINEEEIQKGISLVLINTEKGEKYFDSCKNKIYYEERTKEEAINGNAHLRRPSTKNKFREEFRKKYKKGNLVEVLKKILAKEMKEQKKIYYVTRIKKLIKQLIKK